MDSDYSQLVGDAAFMRSILESSSDCIKVLALDGSLIFMNSGGHRVMEVDDFSKLRGCHWPDFWPGDGKEQALHAVEAARGGRTMHFEGEAPTAKGSMRFWEVVVSPILDEAGKPIRILSVSRDVTARKQIELQRETLSSELQHRVNNVLTVVGAIIGQSLRAASTLSKAEEAISGRIRALAGANSLLTGAGVINTTVSEIVREAAAPYIDAGSRINIDGNDVQLNSRACVALALSINELCTNATKYGALSNDSGRVQIGWQSEDGQFRLTWREAGGPVVSTPTRTSFGTTLINSMFRHQLGGTVSMQFEPSGLVCVLEAPLSALTQEEKAGRDCRGPFRSLRWRIKRPRRLERAGKTMRAWLRIIGAALCATVACPEPGLAQRAYAPLTQGQALLKQHCGSCHQIAWGASPNKEAPPFREIVKRYPANSLEEALAEGLLNGHAPGVQYEFEPTEVDAIVRYLGSLGGKR